LSYKTLLYANLADETYSIFSLKNLLQLTK